MLVKKVTLYYSLELAGWEAGMCLGSQENKQKKGLCHPAKNEQMGFTVDGFCKEQKIWMYQKRTRQTEKPKQFFLMQCWFKCIWFVGWKQGSLQGKTFFVSCFPPAHPYYSSALLETWQFLPDGPLVWPAQCLSHPCLMNTAVIPAEDTQWGGGGVP